MPAHQQRHYQQHGGYQQAKTKEISRGTLAKAWASITRAGCNWQQRHSQEKAGTTENSSSCCKVIHILL